MERQLLVANVMAPPRHPGDTHSFEHREALDRAFRFHLEIGRSQVAERRHASTHLDRRAASREHAPSGPFSFDVIIVVRRLLRKAWPFYAWESHPSCQP